MLFKSFGGSAQIPREERFPIGKRISRSDGTRFTKNKPFRAGRRADSAFRHIDDCLL
jgi:hypothetical protein